MELIVFIGLQAAGKTTFYRRYFEKTHQVVSKDLMKNRPRKSERQERLLHSLLSAGRSVVLDNTNPSLHDRHKAIEIGKTYGARIVAYYFVPEVTANLKRNRLRAGRACVPDVAIYATAKKLRPPSFEEGFDEIWSVRLEPSCEFGCTRLAHPVQKPS